MIDAFLNALGVGLILFADHRQMLAELAEKCFVGLMVGGLFLVVAGAVLGEEK